MLGRISLYALFGAMVLLTPRTDAVAQTGTMHRASNTIKLATSFGAIDGSVRDTSAAWLRGVEIISIDKARISTRSSAGGSFRIDSIPAGPHLIRFRRIGIMPLTVSVTVEPNATVSVDAVVEPFPVTLSRMTVQAVSGELVELPRGVADRMRTGNGTYLTASDIQRFGPRETLDIFRHVAGVSVEHFGHGQIVRSVRATTSVSGRSCGTGMRVVIDGTALSSAQIEDSDVGRVSDVTGGTSGLNGVTPGDIGAIEIYKDGSGTPAEFNDSECGSIYIWTA